MRAKNQGNGNQSGHSDFTFTVRLVVVSIRTWGGEDELFV